MQKIRFACGERDWVEASPQRDHEVILPESNEVKTKMNNAILF
jgi:hypothetical protein